MSESLDFSIKEKEFACRAKNVLECLLKEEFTLGMKKSLIEDFTDSFYNEFHSVLGRSGEYGNGWMKIVMQEFFKLLHKCDSLCTIENNTERAINKLNKIAKWVNLTK